MFSRIIYQLGILKGYFKGKKNDQPSEELLQSSEELLQSSEELLQPSEELHLLETLQQIAEECSDFESPRHNVRVKSLLRDLKLAEIILKLRNFTKDCPDVIKNVLALVQDVSVYRKVSSASYFIYRVQDAIDRTKDRIISIYSDDQRSSFQLSANNDGSVTPYSVMEFMDTVIENLSDLKNFNDPDSDIFSKQLIRKYSERFDEVLEELKFLKGFVCFVSDRCIEPQVQLNFFTHVLQAAWCSAMFGWLYFPINSTVRLLDRDSDRQLFSNLVERKIKPSEPSNSKIYIEVLQTVKLVQSQWHTDFQIKHGGVDSQVGFLDTLLHHLEETSISPNSIKTRENLQEMLKFLRANLTSQPVEAFELHVKDIDSVVVDAGLLVYSLNKDTEHTEREEDQVVDFSDEIQRMQALICHIIRKAVLHQFNVPGLGSIDFLSDKRKEFLSLFSNSNDSVDKQLQTIYDELKHFEAVLKHDNRLKHYVADYLLYEVEYILDSRKTEDVPYRYLCFWMLNTGEDIRVLLAEVAEVQEKNAFNQMLHITEDVAGARNSPQLPKNLGMSKEMENLGMSKEMVGRTDVMDELKGKLIKGSLDLDVISIVGMPGVGKTTLANKLYFDQAVVNHFDIRAQICVSQEYTRKGMLLILLRDIIGENTKLDKETDDVLAHELHQKLFGKRYVILIDDIWHTKAIDELNVCFQKAKKGSRIILTTRHDGVAKYAKRVTDPLVLQLLSNEESWMLLRNQVFNKESCPQVLEDVGKSIATKCGGLPLSVVLIAGILERTEKREDYWKRVETNLGPDLQAQSEVTIDLSYRNLPDYLQPCFLYFAAFSEDQEIQISKLTWWWISEGFVTASNMEKPLEDIAKDYLEDLVGRNLVTVSKKSCDGKIKACRIHDLLLEFCRKKAKLENFLERIKWDKGFDPSHAFPLCRLSLHSRSGNLAEWCLCFSHLKSFQFREARKVAISSLDNSSYIFRRFKFLRVLDFEFTIIDSLPKELTLLRYLAFRTDKDTLLLPSDLEDLETLIVQGIKRQVSLPDTIWKLAKLRHLHIYDQATFTLECGQESSKSPTTMDDLQTISSAWFSCVGDADKILAKTPNLQKLRCEVSKFDGSFPAFDNLIKLEMLKISSGPTLTWIKQIKLPPNLKKLTLSNFGISLTDVATHPKLEVLKLLRVTISSSEWKVSAKVCEVSDEQFLRLKILELENPSFSEWDVSDDAFPCLEHLVLKKCPHLKKIPSRFEEFSSLKSVKIISCNEALAESAMAVRETLEENSGTSGFAVFIHK